MKFAAIGLLLSVMLLAAQSPLDSVKAETDSVRRADRALALADSVFDTAREAYVKGRIEAGDANLDTMAKALDESVSSLDKAHKSRLYKRAEMRVAHLQRRLSALLDNINIEQRGWAEQTGRHLAEIHDKLLEGAMRK